MHLLTLYKFSRPLIIAKPHLFIANHEVRNCLELRKQTVASFLNTDYGASCCTLLTCCISVGPEESCAMSGTPSLTCPPSLKLTVVCILFCELTPGLLISFLKLKSTLILQMFIIKLVYIIHAYTHTNAHTLKHIAQMQRPNLLLTMKKLLLLTEQNILCILTLVKCLSSIVYSLSLPYAYIIFQSVIKTNHRILVKLNSSARSSDDDVTAYNCQPLLFSRQQREH